MTKSSDMLCDRMQMLNQMNFNHTDSRYIYFKQNNLKIFDNS